MSMNKRWRSVAEWDSAHGFCDNKTTDDHDTEEQAKAVCAMLRRDGLGGERIHFPKRAWIEDLKVMEASA